MCRNGDRTYCVDDLSDCYYHDNNCPVNRPIRCGDSCVPSASDCNEDKCDNTLDRCPTG